jgi:hypothetical protein
LVEGVQEDKYKGVVDDTMKVIEVFIIDIDIFAEGLDGEVRTEIGHEICMSA